MTRQHKIEYVTELTDEQLTWLTPVQFTMYNHFRREAETLDHDYGFALEGPYRYSNGEYSYLWVVKYGPKGWRRKYNRTGHDVWVNLT